MVATRVGGPPELISDDENGLLVSPRDPKALATALAACLDDPAARERMGGEGRRRRRLHWSLDAWIAGIAALYRRCLVRQDG